MKVPCTAYPVKVPFDVCLVRVWAMFFVYGYVTDRHGSCEVQESRIYRV